MEIVIHWVSRMLNKWSILTYCQVFKLVKCWCGLQGGGKLKSCRHFLFSKSKQELSNQRRLGQCFWIMLSYSAWWLDELDDVLWTGDGIHVPSRRTCMDEGGQNVWIIARAIVAAMIRGTNYRNVTPVPVFWHQILPIYSTLAKVLSYRNWRTGEWLFGIRRKSILWSVLSGWMGRALGGSQIQESDSFSK